MNQLLAAHPNAIEFLEAPAAPEGEKTAVYVSGDVQPGTIVAGRHKLLETIGEGGTVWVAQ